MGNKVIIFISFMLFVGIIFLSAFILSKKDILKGNDTIIISSAIIGSLVGGSSTIGTVQLAIINGFSAWWFTLGAGLGCLTMLIFYLKPLYDTGFNTFPDIIKYGFGNKIAVFTMILMLFGNMMTTISQIISGISFFTTSLSVNSVISIIIMGTMMIIFLFGGGVYSIGKIGLIKLLLLLLCTIYSIFVIFRNGFNLTYFYTPHLKQQYINIFSRGFFKDINSGISLIFGVITTQTYIQIVTSTRNIRASKTSLFICSLLIPIIGLVYVFIGLYIKQTYPHIESFGGLIFFIQNEFNPLIAGLFFATLLITLVGTASGITLGMSTMLISQLKEKYQTVQYQRIIIVIITIICMIISYSMVDGLILDIGYFAMAIRATVGFIPLNLVLFKRSNLPNGKRLIISITISLLSMIILKKLTDIPLFFSILIGLISLVGGFPKNN